jgi:hypothetical protein
MIGINNSRWILGKRGFYDTYTITFKIKNNSIYVTLMYNLFSPIDIYDPYLKVSCLIQYKDNPSDNFSIEEMTTMKNGTFSSETFFVKIKENILKNELIKGDIKNKDNSVSWSIKTKDYHPSLLYPLTSMYDIKLPSNKISTPAIDLMLYGDLTINNETYPLEEVKSIQTHNWGTSRPYNWIWGHSNNFKNNEDTFFEAYICKRKLPLNFISQDLSFFHLFYKGKSYYFNNPIYMLKNKNDYHIGYWKFKTENKDLKLSGSFEVEYKDLVALIHKDTNNENLFSHYTTIGKLTIDIYQKIGWHYNKLETLIDENNTSIEFVNRYKDPHVELLIE